MADRLLSSLAWQWLATLFVGAVSFGLVVWLARVMGPATFGQYSYVLTIAALLLILQDGGFKTLLLRENAAASPMLSNWASNLFSLAVGHLITVSAALLLLVYWVPAPEPWALLMALLVYGLIALGQMFSAELKGKGFFVKEALWQAFQRALSAVAIVIVILWAEPTITGVLLAWGVGLGVAFLLFPGISWPRPQFALHPEIYRAALAFLVIDVATTIYFRIDVVMLSVLQDDDQVVGEYSAVYRMLEAVILVAAPLATIFFRYLRLGWSDVSASRRRIFDALLLMLGVALVLVGLTWFFAETLVRVVFGESYASAGTLLFWVMTALIFSLPNYVLTQGAIALNKEVFYAGVASAAAIVNVLLNFWLIPNHGAIGAAWATLATEGVLIVFLMLGMRKWLAEE